MGAGWPDTDETILIVNGALHPDSCKEICDYIEAAYQKNPKSRDFVSRTAYEAKVDNNMRITLRDLFYQLISCYVEPHFQRAIEWWEAPQLLRYDKGGKYNVHADAYQYKKDQGWIRDLDRDVSMVLYLNKEFEGGALHFPQQKVTIQPEPGMFVAFPSHPGFRHAAQETKSGVRYAIASWASALGEPKVRDKIAPNSLFMSDFR